MPIICKLIMAKNKKETMLIFLEGNMNTKNKEINVY